VPLLLYNTLTRRIEPFIPADPSRVTFYSCGPTVYDDAHIGNFRSFLAADVLRRWIESPLCRLARHAGDAEGAPGPRTVVHVMNITDVGHMTDDAEGGEAGEDRMAVAGRRLAEAKKAGTLPPGEDVDPSDPCAIARFYESRFRDDAQRLGLKIALEAESDPTLMPRATENVAGMIEVTKRLLDRGHAYVVGGPGARVVYFRVRSFPAYGQLSGNTLARLREGAGGRIAAENQARKEHPGDFLLWKEDPSHIMKWDSPWGKGYPGWHIECSVMSLTATRRRRDGATKGAIDLARFLAPDAEPLIDLHSGGEDNIFPHHESEIAQSCCAFNADPMAATPERGMFAKMWFHPRFLLVEGDRMSKSKGNFYTPRDLFARGVEPAALRLELIKTHYRSNANFTMDGLHSSERIFERWRTHARESPSDIRDVTDGSNTFLRAFADAMNDDLNIAKAVSMVNAWIGRSGDSKRGDAHIMRTFIAPILGIELDMPAEHSTSIGVFADGLAPDPAVVSLLEARRAARAARDFARSDAIRDELSALGYAIKDLPGGNVEVRRM
jgi:cysteinyl-tRNA synthetase